MRTLVAVLIVFAGITLAPDLGSFLAGALITGVGGFMVLLQAGEKREKQLVNQTQDRCASDLITYAEGMAAGLADDGEPVAA